MNIPDYIPIFCDVLLSIDSRGRDCITFYVKNNNVKVRGLALLTDGGDFTNTNFHLCSKFFSL